MASTFGTLEIAKSGMMTYNTALQTTAHNIANIETKGYSKQIAKTTSLVSNASSLIVQGSGVDVTGIERQRNEYYDNKYQATQSTHSYYSTLSYYLDAIQDCVSGGITSDTSKLITDSFDDFYASLSELMDSPSDATMRTKTVTIAQTFTEYIQTLGSGLQKLQEESNTEIKSTVERINSYAEKIASINQQIAVVEAYGHATANDLRDQRGLLLDELAEYCNIETEEVPPSDGVGENQFYVYINGHLLVDGQKPNQLVISQKDTTANQNDITGLYSVSWSDGASFNQYSKGIGGRLQALFEFRDGNNNSNLQGTASAITNNPDGNIVLTVKDTNCNDLMKLNAPAYDGELVINNVKYEYDSFEVNIDDDGQYTYEFTLKTKADASTSKAAALQRAVTQGFTVKTGESVDSKGVPYYMAQLNEFVRTFSSQFNAVQNSGYDMHNEFGTDFFNATVAATGDNYVMNEGIEGDPKSLSFSSIASKNADGTYTGSYYYMTAMNYCVTQDVIDDPGKLACKEVSDAGYSIGNDNGNNLAKLVALKDNSSMFVHGAPDSFLQSITATLGVNAQKAKTLEQSQSNLLYTIDSYRQSTSSVDEDEEGTDLVNYQNLLQYQYKVLSVLNEVLDRLINQTGV